MIECRTRLSLDSVGLCASRNSPPRTPGARDDLGNIYDSSTHRKVLALRRMRMAPAARHLVPVVGVSDDMTLVIVPPRVRPPRSHSQLS